MATYEKLIYDNPPYQEGNEADMELEMEAAFPADLVVDITFQVRSGTGDILISKRLSLNTIALVNRIITIPFPPDDTKGKAGNHGYEIDFINQAGSPFITIGGKFPISKEVNTL